MMKNVLHLLGYKGEERLGDGIGREKGREVFFCIIEGEGRT